MLFVGVSLQHQRMLLASIVVLALPASRLLSHSRGLTRRRTRDQGDRDEQVPWRLVVFFYLPNEKLRRPTTNLRSVKVERCYRWVDRTQELSIRGGRQRQIVRH